MEEEKKVDESWKDKVNAEKSSNGKFKIENHHKVVTIIFDPNTRECAFQVKNVQGKFALFSILREALYQLENQESIQATAKQCALNIMSLLASAQTPVGRVMP